MWRHRANTKDDPSNESRTSKYARLNEEADRERVGHTARRTTNNTRATTLVGAASIGASVTAASHGWLSVGAALMFLISAGIGISALWPTRGPGLAIGPLFDRVWVTSRENIELTLLQVKLAALAADEQSLYRTAIRIRIGLVFILAAIVLLAGHAGAGLTCLRMTL